jgi:serine/threonine protein kinase
MDQMPSLPTKTLEAPREELTTGSTFAGRYQIIEELGKGGMGKVYKVHDTKIKEKIALKLIKPDIAKDKKTIERFSNELKFARKIRHKNICQMFDLGEEHGKHFITMEFVEGQDLKKLIRQTGQLAIGTTINIAKQVCDGLAEAHSSGVVHRDLKPSNIMIDADGSARIMDFGIARSIEGKGITGAGVMIGTPEYMSPEQVEGKEVDHRSDIYSLGVILYEMVTGRVPFKGDTPFTVGMKHKSEFPQNPKEINSQIPDDLNDVILRCLEKDKEQRHQKAGDVRSELESIEKGIPTTERIVPERKPLTSREITVQFSLRKLLIPALAVIAIAIIVVLIWQFLPQKEAGPAPASGKPSVAIMYFKNNTGDENLDNLRSALSDLLITDLSQSKHISVLSTDRLYDILKQLDLSDEKSYSSEDLKKIAARGRVTHIVQGSFIKLGEIFRIDIDLKDARNLESLGSDSIERKGEESIFSMVDELTKGIKTNFKLTTQEIASDIDREMEQITTSSPEAYKYYSEGQKLEMRGDNRKAITLYEKAIDIDPEFALAYDAMAWSYFDLRYKAKAHEFLQKAYELSDRLPDKERYIIQGQYFTHVENRDDKAMELYSRLLQLYPDDEWGNTSLGSLYYGLEQWDKAIEHYQINFENRVDSISSYLGLARSYEAKGLYIKARDVLDFYLNNFPDNPHIHHWIARNHFCQGEYDLALGEIEKAFVLNPVHYRNFMIKGHIHILEGDLTQAGQEYKKILEIEEKGPHQWGRSWLGHQDLLEGKFVNATSQFEQGLEIAREIREKGSESGFYTRLAYTHLKSGNPQRALEESKKAEKSSREERGCLSCHLEWSLLYKGRSQLENNSVNEAMATSDELNRLIKNSMKRGYMRLYYNLEGSIELYKGNYDKSIELFKESIELLPYQHSMQDDNLMDHAFFMNSLAQAYYRAGDLENALNEYDRLTALTVGRLHWGDIYTKSFFMLGKINEELRDRSKAIEHYNKFLLLWKDADPGIPEVEDARERLASLKNQ